MSTPDRFANWAARVLARAEAKVVQSEQIPTKEIAISQNPPLPPVEANTASRSGCSKRHAELKAMDKRSHVTRLEIARRCAECGHLSQLWASEVDMCFECGLILRKRRGRWSSS